jgi:succinoglycan biosynthesis protein ExoV
MHLYYQKAVQGNFGDALNEWLWRSVLPGMWEEDGVVFVGVGTLIDKSIPDGRLRVIFGSGAGYAPPPDGVASPAGNWRIYGVRGPLTARILGLDPRLAVTDSAILVNGLSELRTPRKSSVVFVPHWKSVRFGAWKSICEELNIDFVDPCGDSRDVIRRIASADRVIAESMHAAIIADAFRVPWIPVALSREVSAFKWADWSLSLDLEYRPYCLSPSTRMEAMRNDMLRWTIFENIFSYPPPDRLGTPQALQFSSHEGLVEDFWRSCARAAMPSWRRVSHVLEAGFKRFNFVARRANSSAHRRPSDRFYGRARDGLAQLAAQPGTLSSDAAHGRALARTHEALDALKADWANAFSGPRQ